MSHQRHRHTRSRQSRQVLRHCIASAGVRRLLSLALVLVTLLISALMPLSEITFSGDGFILSGHDSELTLLAFVLFAGLVLILANRAERPPLLRTASVRSSPPGLGTAEPEENISLLDTLLQPFLMPLRI